MNCNAVILQKGLLFVNTRLLWARQRAKACLPENDPILTKRSAV